MILVRNSYWNSQYKNELTKYQSGLVCIRNIKYRCLLMGNRIFVETNYYHLYLHFTANTYTDQNNINKYIIIYTR